MNFHLERTDFMSTKEIAYNIIEQLSEEQLKGFIALFQGVYPTKDDGYGRTQSCI